MAILAWAKLPTARPSLIRAPGDRTPFGSPATGILSAQQSRREREMAERLGLGIIPGAGWRAAEIRAVALDAEDAGFDAIFTPR